MMEQLLNVLRMDDIGKARHADDIEKAYLGEIAMYQPCDKCNVGP